MKSKKLSYNKILVLFCIIVVSVLMTGCNDTPPIIRYFSAAPSTIDYGESSILSWSASYAVHVEITPDVGTVGSSGSTIVSPAITTRYVFIATNSWAEFVTAEVTVTVGAIPLNALHGSIEINSTPPGARIYLDGEDTGQTTPTTLTDVEVGERMLKLTYWHYQDWEGIVTVNTGQITYIDALLTWCPITPY